MVLTGKTREVITGFIHQNRKARFSLSAREHLCIYYGQYWRSFGSDEKAMKDHDNVTNLLKDSMSGPLVGTIAHAVSNRRRFLFFTNNKRCDLWKLQDRVRLVYEFQADADGGETAPHKFFNALSQSRLAR